MTKCEIFCTTPTLIRRYWRKAERKAESKRDEKYYKSRIPTFKSIEEEAAFWDTHSSEEFADELTAIEEVKFVKAHPKK